MRDAYCSRGKEILQETEVEERSHEMKKENLGIGRSQVTYSGALSMGAEARLQFAA